ncbi:MAG: nitroreductase family protein [Nitriliruptorales bacterium]
MEFMEAVRRRRMVRAYRDEPADLAVVERLLDLARRAPSAGFSQGQRFVVVTEAARRGDIARLAGEEQYVRRGFRPWLTQAPVHVVVCGDEGAYRARYREPDKLGPDGRPDIDWLVPYWLVDAGASLMVLLLGAVDAGLAAGFLGVHRIPGLRELLGIPADVHPIGVVTIGHPDPERSSPSGSRVWRPLDEVVWWERWGGARPDGA